MDTEALRARFEHHRSGWLLGTLALATLLAMLLRRPDQWSTAAIWIEEGTIALPDYVAHGWSSVFHPMMGYLVLPTKLILATAATLSFRWLPEIEFALTILFTTGVLAAFAFSPTELKYRPLCALALLALPTDSEVYATSAYAFWWGSLLTILPLVWRRDGPRHDLLRGALLVFGGLSSPLIITLSPLYALRAALLRSRAAVIDLVLAAAAAGLQYSMVMKTAQAANTAFQQITPALFVRKFFGYFVFAPPLVGANDAATLVVGIALLGVLAWLSWRFRRELGPAYFFLIAAFLLAALASVARVPIQSIHPAVAGPRYFFLPFAFLSIAIVQLAALNSRAATFVVVIIAALCLRDALEFGQRRHDPLDWRAGVDHCAAATGPDLQDLPVHWDGHAATAWKARVAPADCRRLVGASWFAGGPTAAGAAP